ncbi:MAG TPA: hypothetical protein VFW96_20750 [Thermomicrobiales bacterium]|nr:hypothetical protein [Thermomicrobiales bacterium]
MAKQPRGGAAKIVERVKEAVDRLSEAIDTALYGGRAVPAVVPVRRPTPEELRRYARRRRRY